MKHQKIEIQNDRDSQITLMLEPWGEDYGMPPNDKFVIIADNPAEDFYFHVSVTKDYISVYAEKDAEAIGVFQHGELLECGHNRNDLSFASEK